MQPAPQDYEGIDHAFHGRGDEPLCVIQIHLKSEVFQSPKSPFVWRLVSQNMHRSDLKMYDKEASKFAMPSSAAIEMNRIVREAALPAAPGESVKAAINRASRTLRLSYSRTRAFWYLDERIKVWADEIDHARQVRRELAASRIDRLRAEIAHEEALMRAMGTGNECAQS